VAVEHARTLFRRLRGYYFYVKAKINKFEVSKMGQTAFNKRQKKPRHDEPVGILWTQKKDPEQHKRGRKSSTALFETW